MGPALLFDDSLTLTMRTGAAHVATVDGRLVVDKMVIYSDGKLVKILPVSLGRAPGEPYYSISVPWSVRITYSGEFTHDAYWNGQIG